VPPPKRGAPVPLRSKRTFTFGYRESERLAIPPLEGDHFVAKGEKIFMDPSLKIHRITPSDNKSRPIVMASLGPIVQGNCQPHPDPSDAATVTAGALYRFCREIPALDFPQEKFSAFVQNWLEQNLTPIDPTTDTSVKSWLDKTPYTLKRKHELMTKFQNLGGNPFELDDRHLKVKSFVKDETYPEYKHARAINSRTDEFKAVVGPICQLVADKLFSLPWFIKKIPIADRPQYIIDRLQRLGHKFLITDYTSFEAHFKKIIMESCELKLFAFLTQFLPDGLAFMKLFERAKCGKENFIAFKTLLLEILAKRMSGEMDTSTSNGFSNLMFMLFLCSENGNTNVMGVIEGDDGLFVMDGDCPTNEMFVKFGLSIKMSTIEDLAKASFCGMVFDLQDKTNVTDPISELVSFGWTTARYAKSRVGVHKCLIRAKALSLAYQYPACPILSKFAYKMCQLTAGYDSLSWISKQGTHAFNLYEIEHVIKSHEYFKSHDLLKAPGVGTRLLVEQLYNITVAEQISLEEYIDGLTSIGPLVHPILIEKCPAVWSDYYESYSIELPYNANTDMQVVTWPAPREPADFSHFMKQNRKNKQKTKK